uniref:B3 domain-containing protein At5g24050 n=1 Tax=Anthurium amnicola TaxID=1678845 RepID=A0A1D1Z7J0_9ARAE
MSKEESCSTTVEEEVESRKRKTPEKAEAGETSAAVAEGDDPQPPCDLDDTRSTWREKVKSMMGTDITRVVVKRAFPTDISHSHARFLLTDGKEDKKMSTEKRAKGPTKLLSFLTEAEMAAANGPQGLPVVLLDRWGLEYQGGKIKYWKSLESYNVVGRWNDFVERNELDPGDVVEVHLFRVPPEMEPPSLAPTAMSSAPATEAPAVPSTAPTEDVGGGGREAWRVGLAVCSLVPEEEVVRRRRDSPEARKSRRKQMEDAMKRKRTPRSGKDSSPGMNELHKSVAGASATVGSTGSDQRR